MRVRHYLEWGKISERLGKLLLAESLDVYNRWWSDCCGHCCRGAWSIALYSLAQSTYSSTYYYYPSTDSSNVNSVAEHDSGTSTGYNMAGSVDSDFWRS